MSGGHGKHGRHAAHDGHEDCHDHDDCHDHEALDDETGYTGPALGHAPDPANFRWSDAFLLGYGPMDDTHREFVDCVRAMLDAPEAGFLAALDAFAAHAERHFGEEREWMVGTSFPAADCHIQEHEAVMNSVREVRTAIAEEREDVELGRALARELVNWFPGHADYMDAALSHWMVKRRHGGKPIVIRRDLAVRGEPSA